MLRIDYSRLNLLFVSKKQTQLLGISETKESNPAVGLSLALILCLCEVLIGSYFLIP